MDAMAWICSVPSYVRLTFCQGKVYLTIAHHKLEGKKTKLAKPLAVITKSAQVDVDAMELDQPRPVTYDVVRIIKEKYVFAHRPSLLVQEDLRGLMKV
jgi:chromosome transmission fidelity protein 8